MQSIVAITRSKFSQSIAFEENTNAVMSLSVQVYFPELKRIQGQFHKIIIYITKPFICLGDSPTKEHQGREIPILMIGISHSSSSKYCFWFCYN